MKTLLLTLLLSTSAFASQITLSPANEVFQNTTLSVALSDGTTTLPLAAYGLGLKKIGLTYYKVAVNQFYVENPANLVRTFDGIYASLNNVGKMAFRLTFLRGVGSDLIQSSIQDAITANMTDAEATTYQSDIQKVSNALLNGPALSFGSSISFVAYPATNQVLFEDASGADTLMQFTGSNFVFKIFAIWFGNQTTKEGAILKTALLTVPQVTPAR